MRPAAVDTPQVLVNGRPGAGVPPLDRGLGYGDGVFRTLRIDAGAPRWWDAQLAQLAADCAHLGIVCPPEAVWRDDLSRLQLPEHGVLRLTVTRGEGERGYRPPAFATPTRIVAVWPGEALADAPRSVAARVCRLRLGHQPALAGVKHLNRLENVLARAEWQDPEVAEGMLLDQAGRAVGGVMSNLFVWRRDTLLTPRIDACGVAGVARARLMERAAGAGIAVAEADLGLDDVLEADELVFTNSVILLWRAARLDGRAWGAPVISPTLWNLLHA
ncbi:MAG: aminodeoxychorismate lyase [Pseudomonadota bacterium]